MSVIAAISKWYRGLYEYSPSRNELQSDINFSNKIISEYQGITSEYGIIVERLERNIKTQGVIIWALKEEIKLLKQKEADT